MDYRPLGRTGMHVSNLCLGAMNFGAWGKTGYDDSKAIIDRALDAGINFVDTADVYSGGESEEIVGRALEHRRDDVILATKCHFLVGANPAQAADANPATVNARGNSRRHIMRAVDDSLRRLRTDWIDLYQIHRPEPETDIDETLSALTDLVRAGKIRAFGSSTFPADAMVEAQWVADRRGRERFRCEQPPYSILVRGVEADVLPAAQRYGMGVIPWSPLAAGWLSGRYERGGDVPEALRAERMPMRFDLSKQGNQNKLERVYDLQDLADEAGLSLIDMALAFVLEHPAVAAPIIGPRTLEHLESQLPSAEIRLPADVLDRIDEIVPPGTVFEPTDRGWPNPALSDPALRRRPHLSREGDSG